MSSKKRSVKEKNTSEDVQKPFVELLVNSRANVQSRENLLLHTRYYNDISGRVAANSKNETKSSYDKLQYSNDHKPNNDRRRAVSQTLSCSTYPYHEVSLTVSDKIVEEKDELIFVADLITSLVQNEIRNRNISCADGKDSVRLFSSSVYSEDLSARVKEEKDQVIGARKYESSPSHSELKVYRHLDSTHVNVCCGLFFYKLYVVDERGDLREREELVESIEAIIQDTQSRKMVSVDVSPKVKEDLRGFAETMANLSCMKDSYAREMRRRLCETSEVNAYGLNSLESGLFTLVLGNRGGEHELADGSQAGAPLYSQWLHSNLSVFVPPLHGSSGNIRQTIRFRVQALLTTLNELLEYIQQLFGLDTVQNIEEGSPVTKLAIPSVGDSSHSVQKRLGSDIHSGVELLPFWLPEKHRVMLQPYPPAIAAPAIISHISPGQGSARKVKESDFPRFAVFLLSVVVAAADTIIKKGGEKRPPRVALAVETQTANLALIELYSKDVEHYLQVYHSDSIVITKSALRTARQNALDSIVEQMSLYHKYQNLPRVNCELFASSEGTDPLDVVVSCAQLGRLWKRVLLEENSSHTECWTDVGVAAKIWVHATILESSSCKIEDGIVLGQRFALSSDVGTEFEEFGSFLRENLSLM